MATRRAISKETGVATAVILLLVASAAVIAWPSGSGNGPPSSSSSNTLTTTPTKVTSTSSSLATRSTQTSTVSTSSTSSSATTTASSSHSESFSSIFQRVVVARVYQGSNWTLSGQTPTTVGRAIAGLNPTYVQGLFYLGSKFNLTQQQVSAYETIREIVLQSSPTARFDVELDALQYNTTAQVVSKMRTINSQLHPDIWFFDYYQPGYLKSPTTIGAAVAFAHSQGQYVGGNVGAGANKTTAPLGSDFLSLGDNNFTLSLSQISSLRMAYGVPILVHLNSNPQFGPTTESCVFIDQWTEGQRASYVTTLASGQGQGGYVYMYNVFYPECPARVAYDSLTDGSMYSTLSLLVLRYNG
jgi:hypothetical protein